MDDTNGRKQQLTAEQDRLLRKVAEVAARKLMPIDVHALSVLISLAFGRNTLQSRIFAQHVNAVRRSLGLLQITHAAAGNPTIEEKVNILQSALEKLGDEAYAVLSQVLRFSPLYASAQPGDSDREGDNNFDS
jgi:hypothetical protein